MCGPSFFLCLIWLNVLKLLILGDTVQKSNHKLAFEERENRSTQSKTSQSRYDA